MFVGIFDFYDLNAFETSFAQEVKYEDGEMIIFKNEDGEEEIGKILYVSETSKNDQNTRENIKIIRKATAHDLQKLQANRDRGEDAVATCTELVKKHELEMYPFYAIYSLDGMRVNIVFTADDRVDFRELVKDLAKALQKQIHLKQIGPRDKARIVDGYGRCGRRFCCRGVLPKLESITMDMVRVQSLEGKGSSKLSGACGKLLCCLKYEVDAYSESKNAMPSIGSLVKLKKPVLGIHDEGVVVSLDILNKKVKISFGNRDFATAKLSEIAKVIQKPVETAPRSGLTNTDTYENSPGKNNSKT